DARAERTATRGGPLTPQRSSQRVDHRVDGIQGHRLPWMAAAAEQESAGIAEGVEETIRERALARARRSMEQNDSHFAALRRAGLAHQRLHLSRTADEKRAARAGALIAPRSECASAEAGEDLLGIGTSGWIGPQEIAAERIEIVRDSRHHGGGGDLIAAKLTGDDLQRRRAGEGKRTGEGLIEEHPDAVPVGG